MNKAQYISMISGYGRKLESFRDEFEIPAITRLKSEVQVRVHNIGQDNKGETRNYKSKAYFTRFKKTNPVQMVKDGDLRRDYNNYVNGGDNVLGFRDKLSLQKVISEDGRRNGTLFGITDEEIDIYKRELSRFIKRVQKKALNV